MTLSEVGVMIIVEVWLGGEVVCSSTCFSTTGIGGVYKYHSIRRR